jgi:hypothetical protein
MPIKNPLILQMADTIIYLFKNKIFQIKTGWTNFESDVKNSSANESRILSLIKSASIFGFCSDITDAKKVKKRG